MKKLLLIFALVIIGSSCSMEGPDTVRFHMEFVPVESVEMPLHFTMGGSHEIRIKYRRPNACHYFDGFYYEVDGDIIIVAPQTIVLEDAKCIPLETTEPDEAVLNFICSTAYSYAQYTFKFYKGEDAQGNQLFEEMKVPVMH